MKKILYHPLFLIAVAILFYILYISVPKNTISNIIPNIITKIKSETESVATGLPLSQYIEVLDGCDPYWKGECVNVRSGPGTEFPVVVRLRTGVVLKISDTVTKNGTKWYKILFSHDLLYPERVTGDWYVSADFVHLFDDVGDRNPGNSIKASSTKRIVVDIGEEKLFAYDGDKLFMEEPISTGLDSTPTPRGTFSILKKTPSRFMQGPIPGVSDQVYDLPGVPWNLYFTVDGAVIHGAYWHDHFGKPWSHGCVNLPPEKAKELYEWADLNTVIKIQN